MDELENKSNDTIVGIAGERLPFYKRGIFWMFVGVLTTCGACIWLFAQRGTYLSPGRPIAFYVAIGGFIIYVAGRILQVLQKRRHLVFRHGGAQVLFHMKDEAKGRDQVIKIFPRQGQVIFLIGGHMNPLRVQLGHEAKPLQILGHVF